MVANGNVKVRVLILAPIGRDANAAAHQLAENNIAPVITADLKDLLAEIRKGAGAALVTEEALFRGDTNALVRWVGRQPAWSDFPFVVLTTRASSATAHAYRLRLLNSLGNVALLERPLNAVTLLSAVRSALRARQRQYEVQEHLLERDLSAAQLEDLVRERTSQLKQANEQLQKQISERMQVEAALQQSQKMEVIGQMTGGVRMTSTIC